VDCDGFLFFWGNDFVFLFKATHNPVDCVEEILFVPAALLLRAAIMRLPVTYFGDVAPENPEVVWRKSVSSPSTF
jgi:hypothetical protein